MLSNVVSMLRYIFVSLHLNYSKANNLNNDKKMKTSNQGVDIAVIQLNDLGLAPHNVQVVVGFFVNYMVVAFLLYAPHFV